MRDAANVTVQRAVVHILDHWEKQITLSEEELILDANKALQDYFSSQVKNALDDAQTGSAFFSSDGDQSSIRECLRILADGDQLIPSSQALARLLFAAMGTDDRIVPGSLAVCLYTASNYPAKTFLALIKLDPTKALVQKVGKHDGKRVVNFDVRSDVMPTTREKLHKAALMAPAGVNKNFDLLILDRQVSAVAANFFAYKFLNTIPALDPRASTEKLFFAAQNAYNKLVSPPPASTVRIEPEDAYALQQHIQAALQTPVVRIKDWVESLPLNEAAKAVVAEELSKKLPGEGQVLVDQQHAREKLLNKKRFRGEYGVLVEVESEHYDDVVKLERTETRPDGKVVTVLTIKVPDIQWVKR